MGRHSSRASGRRSFHRKRPVRHNCRMPFQRPQHTKEHPRCRSRQNRRCRRWPKASPEAGRAHLRRRQPPPSNRRCRPSQGCHHCRPRRCHHRLPRRRHRPFRCFRRHPLRCSRQLPRLREVDPRSRLVRHCRHPRRCRENLSGREDRARSCRLRGANRQRLPHRGARAHRASPLTCRSDRRRRAQSPRPAWPSCNRVEAPATDPAKRRRRFPQAAAHIADPASGEWSSPSPPARDDRGRRPPAERWASRAASDRRPGCIATPHHPRGRGCRRNRYPPGPCCRDKDGPSRSQGPRPARRWPEQDASPPVSHGLGTEPAVWVAIPGETRHDAPNLSMSSNNSPIERAGRASIGANRWSRSPARSRSEAGGLRRGEGAGEAMSGSRAPCRRGSRHRRRGRLRRRPSSRQDPAPGEQSNPGIDSPSPRS